MASACCAFALRSDAHCPAMARLSWVLVVLPWALLVLEASLLLLLVVVVLLAAVMWNGAKGDCPE